MADSATPAEITNLLDALDRWVPVLLPQADRAASIVSTCRAAAAMVDLREPFASHVATIERAAHTFSRHLLLFVDSDGTLTPDTEDNGWPPPDIHDIRRRGGGVRAVTRTDAGVATIRIDGLEPLDVAEPFLEAAVALAVQATGVILDLRVNGGGDPATVAYLAGFILGPEPRSLSTVHGRGEITPWTTNPPPAGLCVPSHVPVAVLTSKATFSSAEALTYHLQARGRVTVIGEPTPGAADHVTPIVLTRHVHAQLPIASVVDTATGSSWEGTGVRPDIECASAIAEDTALDWIRRQR
jgi:hypothetical protein